MPKKGKEHLRRIEKDKQNIKLDSNAYSNRYLDALASILEIKSPCAAVIRIKKDNVFFLSFNESASNLEKQHIKEIITHINSAISGEKMALNRVLSHYIIFNDSWVRGLKSLIRDTGDDGLGNLINNFIQALADKKARLNESYIHPLEKLATHFDRIEVFDSPTFDHFRTILNQKIKSVDTGLSRKPIILNEGVQDFFTFVNDVQNSIKNLPDEKHRIKNFCNNKLKPLVLRPLQDVEKCLYYLIQIDDLRSNGIDVRVLENPNKIHAESNILFEIPSSKIEYIGISRLSCALCHDVQEEYRVSHRGTSGIFFPNMNIIPTQYFKDFITIKKYDNYPLVQGKYNQDRELSDDEKDNLFEGVDFIFQKFKCDNEYQHSTDMIGLEQKLDFVE